MNIIKGKDVNKLSSLWLTPGLLKFTNKKNRLYNQSVRSSSESGKLRYKRCENKLNRLTWTIKRVYLDSRFKEDLKNRPATDLETDQRSYKQKKEEAFPTFIISYGRQDCYESQRDRWQFLSILFQSWSQPGKSFTCGKLFFPFIPFWLLLYTYNSKTYWC